MRTRSQARIENNIHKATLSPPSSSTRASKRGSARNNMTLDHTKPLLQTPANLAYVSVPSCVIGKPRSHSATALLHAATHEISGHHLHAPLANRTLDASASHFSSTDVIAGGLAILGGLVVWTAASETVKRFCA